jgi:proline iminopeptidase
MTLLVMEDESLAGQLREALPQLAPLVPSYVKLGEVRQFPDTSVVWIECIGDLTALHEAAARLVSLDRIDPHYRPGLWTPHVTLQLAGDVRRAIEIARANWPAGLSANVLRLEIVTFAPVKVIGNLDVGLAGVRDSGWLVVGDGHELYWEESGNLNGIPALILHGGPGSGFSTSARRLFDPARYRIIAFDQRSAGRSRPSAADPAVDLATNTTWHLVGDIERLRTFFEVERWVLYGASWGVTLGLAYAEAHPERVAAAVFAGVTTTRQREIDWLYVGLREHLPEQWATFRAGAPQAEDDELVAAYGDLMFDTDPAVRERAALDFHLWEGAMVLAEPGGKWPVQWDNPAFRLQRGRIVTHYFRHAAWLEDGQLLADAERLAAIPAVLVQGMNDPQAPAHTAQELAAAWPGAQLKLIEDGGHATSGDGMRAAIIAALDGFAQR